MGVSECYLGKEQMRNALEGCHWHFRGSRTLARRVRGLVLPDWRSAGAKLLSASSAPVGGASAMARTFWLVADEANLARSALRALAADAGRPEAAASPATNT